MHRQLTAFVEQPSKRTYLAVRQAAMRETPLPLTATDLAELDRLLDAESYEELLARIDALPPSKVLSPRVHYYAAEAAEALGDVEAGELERFLFVLSLKGLLATGDGSQGAPYIVCQATDEYDVLEALELEPARQTLVERDGRICDVLVCSDGREVWFDVTDVLRPVAAGQSGTDSRRHKAPRRPLSVSRVQR